MRPVFRVKRFEVLFAAVCTLVLLFEGAVIFLVRDGTFSIEGKQTYEVTELGSGATVSQAFVMRGEGLRAVGVRLSAQAPASVTVKWSLWRGTLDVPSGMMLAAEGLDQLDLVAGWRWKTFEAIRDGSSHDHWYTFQIQLSGALPRPAAGVAVMASRDNPDRGGVLWVNGTRQPGSLTLRAERQGRTLHRRFLIEAAPNLPRALQLPVVQWTIFAAFHWAMIVFAYAVLREGNQRGSESPAAAIERVS